jgi:hypothetical protein
MNEVSDSFCWETRRSRYVCLSHLPIILFERFGRPKVNNGEAVGPDEGESLGEAVGPPVGEAVGEVLGGSGSRTFT